MGDQAREDQLLQNRIQLREAQRAKEEKEAQEAREILELKSLGIRTAMRACALSISADGTRCDRDPSNCTSRHAFDACAGAPSHAQIKTCRTPTKMEAGHTHTMASQSCQRSLHSLCRTGRLREAADDCWLRVSQFWQTRITCDLPHVCGLA